MNISGVQPAGDYSSNAAAKNTGEDARIKALQQQLQQLGREKQKAIQNKDEDAKKALEKQIAKIREEIQRLKSEASQQQGGQRTEAVPPADEVQSPSSMGHILDIRI